MHAKRRRTVRLTGHLLAVAVVCLLVPSLRADERDTRLLALEGRNLSADEAAQLEAAVDADPNDLSARVQLMAYYTMDRSESTRSAAMEHALWIVRNHPESGAAGLSEIGRFALLPGRSSEGLREAWLEQIEARGEDPRVLANAATFFLLPERELARELLEKAQALEPTNPEWSQRLGQLHSLSMAGADGESKKAQARQALAQLEDALLLTADDRQRSYQLKQIATMAFEAGEIESARAYATELLQTAESQSTDWNYGNAIHHGHLVLGRIALREGLVEQAKEHLLQAGATPGSPQLNSFGPNMTLSKELLEQGETATVLEYFELCGKFWTLHADRLAAWTSAVERGEIPDFRANLRY